MAAKGAELKAIILDKIQKDFSQDYDVFMNGKELRIAGMENGNEVQIKVSLVAAAKNVPHEGGTVTEEVESGVTLKNGAREVGSENPQPTQKELENLQTLLTEIF